MDKEGVALRFQGLGMVGCLILKAMPWLSSFAALGMMRASPKGTECDRAGKLMLLDEVEWM